MADLKLEIVDRAGWRQVTPLSKALCYVGSDPRCDVVLEAARGGGVAPRHLQLLALPGAAGLRVVNLGDPVTLTGRSGARSLARLATLEIAEGDQIRLGDFTLLLGAGGGPARPPEPERRGTTGGLGAAAAPVAAAVAVSAAPAVNGVNGAHSGGARAIGLELRFPDQPLAPDAFLEGVLIIQNLGDRAGAQFRIEVQGLSAACYEIGPGPILFPNAQKEVLFRLRHPRGPSLPAGRQRFRITVTAPQAYPGEAAAVSQAVVVQPYHAHRVSVTPMD
ncbi:MAG: hypothetical protein KA764_21760 [Anaerolineales bacterium]|nr:hypothetical protein [Anaerolineales bacterium]